MKRGERQQLGVTVEEVHAWVNAAQEVRQLAAHMPMPATDCLSPNDYALLSQLERAAAAGTLDQASQITKMTWFDGRKGRQPTEEAASLVSAFHRDFKASASDVRLAELRSGLAARADAERQQLRRILGDAAHVRSQAWQMRQDAAHLPITRTRFGGLTGEEAAVAHSMIEVIDAQQHQAALLLDPSACRANSCAEAHTAVRILAELHAKARQDRLFDLIEQAATAVSARLAAELDLLSEALTKLDQWQQVAHQTLVNADHLPLTGVSVLTARETAVIGELVSIYDANIRAARTFDAKLCQNGACAGLHQPVAVLCAFQGTAAASGDADLMAEAAGRIARRMEAERKHLTATLGDLDAWRQASLLAQYEAEHMPITRSGTLTDSERAAMRTIETQMSLHHTRASALLEGKGCPTGNCYEDHRSGVTLAEFHADCLRSGTGGEITGAAQRVAAQASREREQLSVLLRKVASWRPRVEAIRRSRADATRLLKSRSAELVADSVTVRISGMPIRLIPMQDRDCLLVTSLALLQRKPLLERDEAFLTKTAATAEAVLSAVNAGLTPQLWCQGNDGCGPAHALLPRVHGRMGVFESELNDLTVDQADMPFDLSLLTEPALGFAYWLPGDRYTFEWLTAAVSADASAGLRAILYAASITREAADRAHAAADKVRAEDVASALKTMDLDALRKASPKDKIRVAPLEAYGVHNIWDVLDFQKERTLASVPGLGDASARAITQAALRLADAVRDDTPVRIDVKRKSASTSTLLEALRRWDATRRFRPAEDELALASALTRLLGNKPHLDRVLAMTEGSADQSPQFLNDILISALAQVTPPPDEETDTWLDFLSRPADYFGMLTELGFTTEDEKKMHGDLPEEVIESVRSKELKRDFLTASLRTYQAFGARFALTQEKVLIGDEMGLGKTVEALAVFAHLRATGHSHFLVVCPAAVVINWVRETAKHTRLNVEKLHGPLPDRERAAKAWVRNGGVAVTTYTLLAWAHQEYIGRLEVGCAVFDEAHYIKNPTIRRARTAVSVMDSVKYAVLMTGTPMENNVQEFRNLIGYIRSDLAESAPEFPASKFRRHLAPAYLRRNQADVLSELPELVETDEWIDMSYDDDRDYRDAVQEGSLTDMGRFANMRRTAMLSKDSHKVARLLEIVEEAKANGHRVLVFSYFLDVLDRVKDALPGQVFGPLRGATPATERQAMVDRFSAAGPGAVLVGQIKAAGEGLNIQSASVVVICEPQLTPTMESQAIARAHRMGQKYRVQVHRLLTESSVDERVHKLVAEKRRLFDEFARDSVIAEQAPDAVDFSESEIARIVVAAERERLAGQPQCD
jgi:superfamily II DNA or RNA helicase